MAGLSTTPAFVINWPALAALLKTYAIQRLTERSTWLGLIALLTAAGISIAPDLIDKFATFGSALGGLILVLTQDKPKPPVVTAAVSIVKAP